MIITEPPLGDRSDLRTSEERQNVLNSLLDIFRGAFPKLHFELIGESKIINAQAVVLDDRREVRVYGGLAFHPLAGESAIMFTLLHESGHHLAGGCRLPWDPRLACECAADYWAASEGASILATVNHRPYSLEDAIRELDLILAAHHQSVEILAYENSGKIKNEWCWALNWAERQQSLFTKRPVRAVACPLADLVLSHSKLRGYANGNVDRHYK